MTASNAALAKLIAILLAGVVLAGLALRPPAPASADTSATGFSAERAFVDVRAIAQRPRPIGSAEAARVRDYLALRLRGLGLETVVRQAPGAQNIVGVLAGTDPAEPAVVLMSHYDSVASGPGAGDDAAGVAASLEIVRALKAAGPHRRDVMVLITDGEEAGLLGARAFFAGDPMRTRVGVVLNLEARGAGGRAVMFETHREAGAMIAFLNRSGALRGASSLMPDLYRRLPNDTDLSIALAAGREGLNFAFFGDQAAYHTAKDTPERLDQGSLQHIGDQVLQAAATLADAPLPPGRSADLVYADILGGPVVSYPPWAGLIVIALSMALAGAAAARLRRQGAVTWLQIARGAAAFLLLLTALAVVLTAAGLLVGLGRRDFAGLLDRYPLLLGGYLLTAAGTALLVLAAFGRSKGPWRRTGPAGLWLGAQAALSILALAVQLAAPMDAFILAWPLAAAALALAVTHLWPRRRAGSIAAALIAALALAQVAYWAGLLFGLVGIALPGVLAVFAALATVAAMPWAAGAVAARSGLLAAAGLLALGAATLTYAAS